ncbi:hypothetical protein [Gloeobacter kilaueensis]|uniref:Uncharacterized protein n=1 Tax=Gloeobacter kilaueensis (strain ATCC BAA-2537 / CCAP 1431/1 / ULC 316 / JS1) TaxID=1183438 RepID=U5QM95_GLOK1|nr:hypothetical protein [Gloeobacter kilaueensis]AGY59998.1 hypothetical protein GKIL_3752 [Gloeobacter kilaueensis JS1]
MSIFLYGTSLAALLTIQGQPIADAPVASSGIAPAVLVAQDRGRGRPGGPPFVPPGGPRPPFNAPPPQFNGPPPQFGRNPSPPQRPNNQGRPPKRDRKIFYF